MAVKMPACRCQALPASPVTPPDLCAEAHFTHGERALLYIYDLSAAEKERVALDLGGRRWPVPAGSSHALHNQPIKDLAGNLTSYLCKNLGSTY